MTSTNVNVPTKLKGEGMAAAKILIVEDEPNMVAGLRDNFEFEGFEVLTAPDGVQGLERALKESPDLVVLDVMMPRMSGLDVCKQLKAKRPSIPIIMLTARGQTSDKVDGLKIGADDYVTKPFNMLELMARVEALLRRAPIRPAAQTGGVDFGAIHVDLMGTEATRDGKVVNLSAREFQLLRYFIEHRGATLSRDELLKQVWGYSANMFTRTVDVHVASLRQKLEDDPKQPQFILTMQGIGYKFKA